MAATQAATRPQPSGLLVVDKPRGVTSHDLVAAARAGLHTKKVGHAGTLDPMATGVLVIGFGNATKLLSYIVDHDKTYEATIRLGRATETDDADGALIEPDETTADADALTGTAASRVADIVTSLDRGTIERTIAERLTGTIEQVPNAYSAIKINGQRAYDLARDGKDVALAARPVTVSAFTVLDMRAGYTDASRTDGPLIDGDELSSAGSEPDTVPVIDLDVRVSCSAGTYIRALGRDLGMILGCGGYLTRLRRTRVGRFDLASPDIAAHVATAHVEPHTFVNRAGETVTHNRAILDQTGDELLARTMSMEAAVHATMPVIDITAEDANNLRYGRRIPYDIREVSAAVVPAAGGAGGADGFGNGDVAAIVKRAKRGEATPVVVFAAS
ncbi:tRNA pseudouridine synthase B [Bifidobacterium biavatii]|uniref:tRNA pseudouridine synthase B n=1 Tax=Bifidobacterium biavatii DSM 23969 TaxID=1437608 RepID=A0A086Z663_9BIFI|nr:tRNA pseudouridine(55) synthase TruB [Bifidobacterium biavatii]KFI42013.1 tRNA pseudouridine synthase B [Bifidobacterium biavatii DSM 23969]